MAKHGLPADALYRVCDPSQFDFETTAELSDVSSLDGQTRARAALALGAQVAHDGFNLFVAAPTGLDAEEAVVDYLKSLPIESASGRGGGCDYVYVNDFENPNTPYPLTLSAGKGAQLRDGMAELIAEILDALDDAISGSDYVGRRTDIEKAYTQEREAAFDKLNALVQPHGLVVVSSQDGIQVVPGTTAGPAEPQALVPLSVDEKTQLTEITHGFSGHALQLEKRVSLLDQERFQALFALAKSVCEPIVGKGFRAVGALFKGEDDAQAFLHLVHQDMMQVMPRLMVRSQTRSLANAYVHGLARRYGVNVFVARDKSGAVPVIRVKSPSGVDLFGHVAADWDASGRHKFEDCLSLVSGQFHAAQGGYLVLNLTELLDADVPLLDIIVSSLKNKEICVGADDGFFKIVAGQDEFAPKGLPLDVTVVLVGSYFAYRMLRMIYPDFRAMFKVPAEFDDRLARSPENDRHYARLLASVVRREKLKPLSRAGVARVIEHSARLVSDSERVVLYMDPLLDVLREADHYAHQDGANAIGADHVHKAIQQNNARFERVPALSREHILRDSQMIDTDGAKVGQVNGLFIYTVSGRRVGEPAKVSARARVGKGEVLQIDHEADLSFEIHSKGAKIMESFLKSHYAFDVPFCLDASVAFEQSYAMIDGDSASSTELYALLSAISQVPILQSYAVTGSVNQFGEVQTIGGVNEKIEGFFDLCAARGLTGRQGVMIPQGNVKNLMLRADVVDAVKARRFAVHAVSTINEGIEILTGQRAGVRGWNGVFPRGSVNRKVEDRLIAFARAARQHNSPFRRPWWR